jgi:diguanylate cyclase (GGDEF)-like protein
MRDDATPTLEAQLAAVAAERDQLRHALSQLEPVVTNLSETVTQLRGVVQSLISERSANQPGLEQALTLLANDPLTHLPNRWSFQDTIDGAIARGDSPFAVLTLDVDRFSVVNASLGREAGDRLIRAVANRLLSFSGDSHVVARLDGDVFALRVNESDDLDSLARGLNHALSDPFELEGQEVFLTSSIGMSVYPKDGDTAAGLITNANVALQQAKSRRNTFVRFDPSMMQLSAERLALESGLRHALERNEFVLHYQPQVCLNTGQIVGTEALIRWNHPALGLVAPNRFIPLAEETGLIIPMTEWALRTACAQTKAWHAAGFADLRLNVNLSGRHFLHEGLIGMVLGVVLESGLDPTHLELEITESTLMQNVEPIDKMLQYMSLTGLQFALDDFGTGYSSFGYLKRFPIRTLKIDRMFLREVPHSDDDAALVAAMVAMARTLKMRVLAEGVETKEQLEFLRRAGCDEIQGFYFSRPVPPEELLILLNNGRSVIPR